MLSLPDNNQFDVIVIQSKKDGKDGKDQESIQSSTTPDLGYHMGK